MMPDDRRAASDADLRAVEAYRRFLRDRRAALALPPGPDRAVALLRAVEAYHGPGPIPDVAAAMLLDDIDADPTPDPRPGTAPDVDPDLRRHRFRAGRWRKRRGPRTN